MERPLPFQPADRARHPPGWMLSAGLHLLMLLTAFWYLTARPALPPLISALPVDLVMLTPVTRTQISPSPPGRSAPRPAVAPPAGTRPDAVTPLEDELGSKLQALSQLRAPDGPLNLGAGEGPGNGGGLSLSDYIRAQILRRWVPDLSRFQRRDRPVMLRVSVSAAGVITDVVILDRQQFNGDLLFRNMAIGARNAAVLTSPVRMPPGNWPAVSILEITLDPRAASR